MDICIQPAGGGAQTVGEEEEEDRTVVGVPVGVEVGVSLCAFASDGVMVGKFSCKVGGICVGVAREGNVSARDRKIPPITRMAEINPMVIPTLNWRKGFMATYFSAVFIATFFAIGKSTLNVEPTPGSLSTQMRPFCASVRVLAMERPTPVSPTP